MTTSNDDGSLATPNACAVSLDDRIRFLPKGLVASARVFHNGHEDDPDNRLSYLLVRLPFAMTDEARVATLAILAAAVQAELPPWCTKQVTPRLVDGGMARIELDTPWTGNADEDMGDAVVAAAAKVAALRPT